MEGFIPTFFLFLTNPKFHGGTINCPNQCTFKPKRTFANSTKIKSYKNVFELMNEHEDGILERTSTILPGKYP